MFTPAIQDKAPAREPLIAIAPAGARLVAAGLRGVIAVSNDDGKTWAQSSVPVQSDLTAVQFPDARNGWAVGHNGVILHSTDGGATWIKQLDGDSARTAFEAAYRQQIAAGNAALAPDLAQIQLNFDAGPNLPWLGVWFDDTANGYAVGSFGDLAITHDGGKTWLPWLAHIDDPNFFDLDDIKRIGGQLYITGEQGSVWWYDPKAEKFVARATSYDGSLFGITGTAKTLIAFGMRGNIFRSEDQGKTWAPSQNQAASSIMSGTVAADGGILLVDVDGGILVSHDDGQHFQLRQSLGMPLTDVLPADARHGLVLTGLGGIAHAQP